MPRSDSLVQKNSSLWPLQEGNTATFTEVVTSHKTGESEKNYRVNWTCEVIGTERVAVMAGEFNTWKITCNRYNNFKNPSKAAIKETRTWNYAPDVNHYILTERLYAGGKAARRLELLAILPPLNGFSDLARRQIRKSFMLIIPTGNCCMVTWNTTVRTSA
ncbi:MAG: hypothetical protein GY850_01235 [bacterium]|nr:hypothetical protein [bacterium]